MVSSVADGGTGEAISDEYYLAASAKVAAVNEAQLVTINGGPTGGTFTLSFNRGTVQTTAAIAYNAAASAVQVALEALSNIGAGNVAVTGSAGGPYTVTFQGTLAGVNVNALTATPSLTGGSSPSITVTTTTQGSPATATITVGTLAPNNPYKGRVVTGVILDGATGYTNIVPGIIVIFASATANADATTVFVGLYNGTFDAFGAGAGVPSASTRHQVLNDGLGAVSNAVAKLLSQAVLYRKTGSGVFNYIRPFADGATEKTNPGSTRVQPYNVGVVNVSGAGSAKVCDLQVDGVTLGSNSILDLSTGALVSGSGLKAISPGYAYRIQTGVLVGLEFAIDASVANGDVGNVLIFNSRYVQIAPDVAGAPGTWGTANVTLTQAGQASGVIQPGGAAYYHSRILVPSGASSESNPFPGEIALQGTETGSANWAG
jgi:hypothetical protein